MRGVALPGTDDKRAGTAVSASHLGHKRTQRVQRMECMNAGMIVFAGPFLIQSCDLELRKREIAACKKMKGEFQAAKVLVKVVLNCDGAWVLRAKDGLRTNLVGNKEKVQSIAPRRMRAWGTKKGDS